MKIRILEGDPWTICMLVSPLMMTTLSMINLVINNNSSWIFFSSNHVSAVLDSAILTDYFNTVMKTRILEGDTWTTCMLVSIPMMTTLTSCLSTIILGFS